MPFVQTSSENGSKPADTHSDNQRISKHKVNNSASKKQDKGAKSSETDGFEDKKLPAKEELAVITMWKKKNSTHTDANHNVTPISDSSEVPDSKDIAFLFEKQGDGKKVYLETEELDNPELSERIDIADDDWTEGDNKYPTHKRTITQSQLTASMRLFK